MLSRAYWKVRDLVEPHPRIARPLERWRRRRDHRRDPMLAHMVAELEPGSVVFDVGAGVGLYSIVLSSRIERSSFYAFEPNPATRERLHSSIALESRAAQISVLPMALGDHTRTQPFFISSQAGRSSLRAFNAERGGGVVHAEIEVPCSTVDALVESGQCPPPDALKIDVEGYEYEVICGAERTIERHLPRIYFESHARQGPQQNAPLILERLSAFGYRFRDSGSRFSGSVESRRSRP